MPLIPVRNLLDRLSVSPVRLRALLTRLPERALRTAPPAGGFAPIENAWHLRDIEVEGHFPRIRRILARFSLPSTGTGWRQSGGIWSASSEPHSMSLRNFARQR
jgi:hypothetical protein